MFRRTADSSAEMRVICLWGHPMSKHVGKHVNWSVIPDQGRCQGLVMLEPSYILVSSYISLIRGLSFLHNCRFCSERVAGRCLSEVKWIWPNERIHWNSGRCDDFYAYKMLVWGWEWSEMWCQTAWANLLVSGYSMHGGSLKLVWVFFSPLQSYSPFFVYANSFVNFENGPVCIWNVKSNSRLNIFKGQS